MAGSAAAPAIGNRLIGLGQRWLSIAMLGAIGMYGSEMLFWSAPPSPVLAGELAQTWLAYALVSAAALMAMAATGARGWLAVFLAGCIYGWLIEGVVVQTVYDVFPYTLVFTGMSWHALLTVLLVGLGVRSSVNWSLPRQLLFLLGLGLFFGLWAQYWPIERPDLPQPMTVALYLIGLGLCVPLANLLLDAQPSRLVFTRWEIISVGGLFSALWVLQLLDAPDWRRLSVPLLVVVTLWLLRRRRNSRDIDLGTTPMSARWRHWLFLLVPVLTAMLASLGWSTLGGVETNWPIAIATSLLALGLFGTACVTGVAAKR
ncbi:hypothetical protein [Devosia sp. SL43]|uniref:hypothetical protein n=1 Tax=Devosia sp. SL43 TaxID=2806348 RepID=UPI001F3FD1AA|nr:hypothetical protein [Devosia sp. SL43]UJW86810.1 hypothetical protein IM737_06045 [Devosia sp. SL43]